MQETDDPSKAVQWLREGHALFHPTESVYGIGILPSQIKTLERLRVWKERPSAAGFILVGADRAHFEPYLDLDQMGPKLWSRLQSSSASHPTTWIVPARSTLAPQISGGGQGVAVRWTAHPLWRQLLMQLGTAMISTSANRRGESAATCWHELESLSIEDASWFRGWRAPRGDARAPSAIYDLIQNRWIRPPLKRATTGL